MPSKTAPREMPIRFRCGGNWLYGILHPTAAATRRGVLIVVGGAQYRVGSHRQFVLTARALAIAGIPAMRFDYRGMGDSEGELGLPEASEHTGPDLRAAIDYFLTTVPDLQEVVLCGLCDGASAAMMYAPTDPRVTAMVLLNPWVGSIKADARAHLRHYYLQRLLSREFWGKLLRGRLGVIASARSLAVNMAVAFGRRRAVARPRDAENETPLDTGAIEAGERIDRLTAEGLAAFEGRVLLVLSGRDMTATQYADTVAHSRSWRRLLKSGQAARCDIPEADHTFSSRVAIEALDQAMCAWLRSW
jgi:exosortase A-associated hydrolase 1